METQVTSKKFSLNKFDWLKAALMATGTPVIDYLLTALTSGGFESVDWKRAALAGVSAFLLYISKNFFSTSTTTVKV